MRDLFDDLLARDNRFGWDADEPDVEIEWEEESEEDSEEVSLEEWLEMA